MELEKEKVINRVKEAKSYGLNHAQLAREMGIPENSIYMFVNGNYNMSKQRQLKALCVIEKYMEQVKEQLRTIDHKGLCTK